MKPPFDRSKSAPLGTSTALKHLLRDKIEYVFRVLPALEFYLFAHLILFKCFSCTKMYKNVDPTVTIREPVRDPTHARHRSRKRFRSTQSIKRATAALSFRRLSQVTTRSTQSCSQKPRRVVHGSFPMAQPWSPPRCIANLAQLHGPHSSLLTYAACDAICLQCTCAGRS